MSIILNFLLKNKYTFIVILILGVIGYISFLNISIKVKDKKIDSLNNKVMYLNDTNYFVEKGLTIKSNDNKINDSFNYSDNAITTESNNISESTLNIYNAIIDDYYKTID